MHLLCVKLNKSINSYCSVFRYILFCRLKLSLPLFVIISDNEESRYSYDDQDYYNSYKYLPNFIFIFIICTDIITAILWVAIHIKIAFEAITSVELIYNIFIDACSRSPTVTPAETVLTISTLTFTITGAYDQIAFILCCGNWLCTRLSFHQCY